MKSEVLRWIAALGLIGFYVLNMILNWKQFKRSWVREALLLLMGMMAGIGLMASIVVWMGVV